MKTVIKTTNLEKVYNSSVAPVHPEVEKPHFST
jgi:hypothetical protein